MAVKRSIPSSEGFDRVFSTPDKKVSSKHFLLLSKENGLGVARIGVAVRKKDIRLAVHRNKIKRKIKGSFVAKALNLAPADYVVLVKKNISQNGVMIKKELDDLWDKIERS